MFQILPQGGIFIVNTFEGLDGLYTALENRAETNKWWKEIESRPTGVKKIPAVRATEIES